MASQALTATPSASLRPAGARWIQSPRFDLCFFVLSPILTLPIVFTSLWNVPYFPFLGFLLAFAHYLSTTSFLLWDENRPYHRARWVAYYGGPALMTLAYGAIVAMGVPLVIQFVLFFWNVFHVARQSGGLASLYRRAGGALDQSHRRTANAALLGMNFWFCLWNIQTHHEVMPVLEFVGGPAFAGLLWAAAGAVGLYCLAQLLVSLYRRRGTEQAATLPELLILATGIGLYHPFLWLEDSGGATWAMLLPHYIQYLGIVWLLHRRKFPRIEGSRVQRLLLGATHTTPRLLITLAVVTLALGAAKVQFHYAGHGASFENFYLLVALLHFYMDGLVWAFRDPHVRKSIGPYL